MCNAILPFCVCFRVQLMCHGTVDGMGLQSLLTATPVQLYVGRRFYVNAWKVSITLLLLLLIFIVF